MGMLSITEVWGLETLTYPPTKNYNSERNNRTGTRPQFWLYCVIGRLLLSKMETYKWHTIEHHNNNEETMNDYLENHLSDEFEVIFEDGTYVEIKNKNTGAIWGVNASGDGDSIHHKVEFEFVH